MWQSEGVSQLMAKSADPAPKTRILRRLAGAIEKERESNRAAQVVATIQGDAACPADHLSTKRLRVYVEDPAILRVVETGSSEGKRILKYHFPKTLLVAELA